MIGAPLRFAPPVRCHRDLEPGEVKRIAAGRLLVGYYLRCPGCAGVLQASGEAFVETPPIVEEPAGPGVSARVRRPTALATRAPVACRCGRGVVVRDARVELAP